MTKAQSLLSEKEVATYLGVTIRALQQWRQDGKGPKFLRLSRRLIRYRQEDIEKYIETNTVFGGMKT